MVNTDEFSKRLQKIFDYYDLNASAFADKIDVGRATISHLLSGRNKPSLDFVMRVVKTFPEVELYWLLNGKGEFPKSDFTSTQDDSKKLVQKPALANIPDSSKIPDVEKMAQNMATKNPSHSEIERIVIFYKNGVFKTYTPE